MRAKYRHPLKYLMVALQNESFLNDLRMQEYRRLAQEKKDASGTATSDD